MASKNAKKVTAPKPAKVAKPAAVKKSNVKFVSFSFGATIPTQSFGNVQPHIVVEAPTYEEARDFAIPRIEELYRHFAEVKPTFLGKITETVKVVAPANQVAPAAPTVPGPTPEQVETQRASTTAPEAPAAPQKAKPESVLKAEKAISLAATADAALAIQNQIDKSVKIPEEFKADLITLMLKKRSELK